MNVSQKRLVVRGTLRLPGDKSISHRSLMLAALAGGTSRIRGLLGSDDIESTARVLRGLGFGIPALAAEITVAGGGLRRRSAAPDPLNCGNSGTTARLILGMAAASPLTATFTGDASLSRRPMRRVTAPLTAMGARFEFTAGRDGLPLVVRGGELRALEWTLESASAQVKSALLLAGVCGGVAVSLREPSRSRDHTERMLRSQGASLRDDGGRLVLEPPDRLAPLDLVVPGDASTAAFFVALGTLADDGELVLRGVGLNPGRTGFLDVLGRMGAKIEVANARSDGPEPVGDLVVRPAGLQGTSIVPDEIPALIDELPVLACVAARAEGETTIYGAAELRVKESDRIAAVVANLRAVGADAEELPDGLVVRGSRLPLSGPVRTHGDHRLAMAFGVLAATADADIEIDDPACVAVSHPGFWNDLERVVA